MTEPNVLSFYAHGEPGSLQAKIGTPQAKELTRACRNGYICPGDVETAKHVGMPFVPVVYDHSMRVWLDPSTMRPYSYTRKPDNLKQDDERE